MEESEYTDSLEESLDELREAELKSEEITANDDYNLDDQEEPSSEVILTPKKTRKKLIIPPGCHPLQVFMLTCDFKYGWGWGDLTGITKLSKEELLGIIRGDMPTEYQRQRIRLTTGVKL